MMPDCLRAEVESLFKEAIEMLRQDLRSSNKTIRDAAVETVFRVAKTENK